MLRGDIDQYGLSRTFALHEKWGLSMYLRLCHSVRKMCGARGHVCAVSGTQEEVPSQSAEDLCQGRTWEIEGKNNGAGVVGVLSCHCHDGGGR